MHECLYVRLTDIMHPAILHGVGIYTLAIFTIFAAFKESITLNLAQRSFKVIHFGGNRKPVYATLYRPLIVTFALCSTVSENGDIAGFIYVPSQLCK